MTRSPRRGDGVYFAVRWLDLHPDAPGELRLWRAVLKQAVSDLADDMHRGSVLRWLGSQDFDTVCQLADVEPQAFVRLLVRVGLVSC